VPFDPVSHRLLCLFILQLQSLTLQSDVIFSVEGMSHQQNEDVDRNDWQHIHEQDGAEPDLSV
jgi:hypothetical protein